MWYSFENYKIDSLKAVKLGKFTVTDGDVFYDAGYFANNAFHYVIYFSGSPDEAKKFSCTISVANKDGEKFTYTGKVHTLDEKADDIIASASCFKIDNNFVKKSLDEEKILHIELTIRNLKREAKDEEESGVSDGK